MSATFLKIKDNKRGITLIETIIYMVLLTLVMGVIVQMLVAMGGVYRNIKLTREIESSGTIAMESMLREIRNASNVVTSGSTLEESPGKLIIAGTDESFNPYNMTFDTAGGAIRVSKDGDAPAALTSSSVAVNYLLFNRVSTSTSEGVRIELEISGKRFYGFTVLRGSY